MECADSPPPLLIALTPLQALANAPDVDIVSLIYALYARQIYTFSDIKPHLHFELCTPEQALSQCRETYHVFHMLVCCYLRGTGHPDCQELRNIISTERIEQDSDSQSLRPVMFMQAIRASSTLPSNPQMRITVRSKIFIYGVHTSYIRCRSIATPAMSYV